jgi:hypothetical protein
VNVYPFMEAERAGGGNIHRACTLLKVSSSAYYAHRTAASAARARQDPLNARAVAIHDESKGTSGSELTAPDTCNTDGELVFTCEYAGQRSQDHMSFIRPCPTW